MACFVKRLECCRFEPLQQPVPSGWFTASRSNISGPVTVLYCLGHVAALNDFFLIQIGDGAGNLQNPVIARADKPSFSKESFKRRRALSVIGQAAFRSSGKIFALQAAGEA